MVVYAGIFVKKSITAKTILSRKISHPHLTLAYMPDKSVIEKLKPYLGYSFRMTVSGYGCDGENEGYLISEISHKSKEIPEVMELFNAIETPHITLSVGKYGKPVNTKNLDFKPIKPFQIKGTLGNYVTEDK
jgi:hypothetical protein